MSAATKTTGEKYEAVNINLTIPNFTANLKDNIIESDVVTVGSGNNTSKWKLQVYPNREPGYVDVFLTKVSTGKFSTKYSFILYDAQKKVIQNLSGISYTFKYKLGDSYGYRKFIERKLLFDKIAPTFLFDLSCEIKIYSNIQLQNKDPYAKLLEVCRENLSDLKIHVEDVTLDAHKFIIAAHSPILYQEVLKIKKPSSPLSITEFGAETISTVLKFMYNKEYQLTSGNVEQICLASKKYQILALQKRCQDFMSDDLDLENALETLEFSDRNGLKDLFSSSLKFATDKIRELIESDIWNNFILCHKGTFMKLFESVLANSKLRLTQNPFITNHQFDTSLANSSSASRTLNDFGNLLSTSSFSDFEILVEGNILKAHKLILSCRSKVFKSMFKNNTRENRENRVEIPDLSYQTVKELLNYMYTGEVDDLKKNAVNLYVAADKYDLPELRKICKNEMNHHITVDNVLQILKMVDLYADLKDLKSKAASFVYKNHEELFCKREWTDFAVENPKILDELLKKFLNF